MVDWGVRGSIGSLKDFTVLKTLGIFLSILLGWFNQGSRSLVGILPSSLTQLYFRADILDLVLFQSHDAAVKEPVECFVGSESRGNLQVIRYELLGEHFLRDSSLLKEVGDVNCEAGISFRVIHGRTLDDESMTSSPAPENQLV